MELNSCAEVIVVALTLRQSPRFKVENGSGVRWVVNWLSFLINVSISVLVNAFQAETERRLRFPSRSGVDETATRVFPGGAASQDGCREPDDRQDRTLRPLSFAWLVDGSFFISGSLFGALCAC